MAVRAPASCRGFSFWREAASLGAAQLAMRSTAVSRQDDSGQVTMGAVYRLAMRVEDYRATGPQTPEGAWPMAKELLAEKSCRRR